MQQPWKALYIQNLWQDLIDPKIPLNAVLERCGEPHLNRLLSAARQVANDTNPNQGTYETLKDVKETAYKNLSICSEPRLLAAWIQLFTLASLFLALGPLEPSSALEPVAILDHIIIICGVASGRLELIHALITRLQREFLSHQASIQHRFCLETSDVQTSTKTAAMTQIPVIEHCPSLLQFQSDLAFKPFVLRGYAEDWPALTSHPWRSTAYLKSVSGPGRVVPVEIGEDYRDGEWSQEIMSWDTFLDSLDPRNQLRSTHRSKQKLYLAQYNLFVHFPALRDDIEIPDYIYATVDNSAFKDYKPPNSDENLVINAWLGPKGTLSPAHTDPYLNLFVQVVGYKTVWLAPPEVSSYLQSPTTSDAQDSHPTHSMLSNTSSWDVFYDDRCPLADDFPKEVILSASCTTLGPGDLLFIPPGWWHSMRSETTSFSVSMWF